MSRSSKVSYYRSRKAYFTRYRGTQHLLAVGPICLDCIEREEAGALPVCVECRKIRARADQRFAEIMLVAQAESEADGSPLIVLLDSYLHYLQGVAKAKTFTTRKHFLTAASLALGTVRVRELKIHHVEDWLTLKREEGWGEPSCYAAVTGLLAALNWALRRQTITRNPLHGIAKPEATARGGDCLITPEQHARIVAYCAGRPSRVGFGQVIAALESSGARPAELYAARATDWDDDVRGFRYLAETRASARRKEFTHKNATKGKYRTVCFIDEAVVAMVRELVERAKPDGFVFQTSPQHGSPGRWTDHSAHDRIERLRKALGLPTAFVLYSYRHLSINRMLLRRVPIALVAEWHGTSVETIEGYYKKLSLKPKEVRDTVLDILRQSGEGSV